MIFFPTPPFRPCFAALALVLPAALSGDSPVPPDRWNGETPVAEVLFYLEEKRPSHHLVPSPPQVLAGEKLVRQGQIRDPAGSATPRLSPYFVCADCHNTEREVPDLAELSDPSARLKFAAAKGLSLLPGTTFAGVVNRESWYNGDYEQKYRSSRPVRAARSDLRKAIEFCCVECSQGRKPEDWETEALLAFFWSLQWKVADLGATGEELAAWKRQAVLAKDHAPLVEEIKKRYATSAPATFGSLPENAGSGFPIATPPDPEVGRTVFTRSCLRCHDPAEGAADEYFRDDEKTRARLSRLFRSDSGNSLYRMIRQGTHAPDRRGLYMPNFTRERLSDFHIESLRAYLSE